MPWPRTALSLNKVSDESRCVPCAMIGREMRVRGLPIRICEDSVLIPGVDGVENFVFDREGVRLSDELLLNWGAVLEMSFSMPDAPLGVHRFQTVLSIFPMFTHSDVPTLSGYRRNGSAFRFEAATGHVWGTYPDVDAVGVLMYELGERRKLSYLGDPEWMQKFAEWWPSKSGPSRFMPDFSGAAISKFVRLNT